MSYDWLCPDCKMPGHDCVCHLDKMAEEEAYAYQESLEADSNMLEESALKVEIAVEDDVVAIQVESSDGDTGVLVAFPNDGQNHREEVGFLVAALPQILEAAYNELEAQ